MQKNRNADGMTGWTGSGQKLRHDRLYPVNPVILSTLPAFSARLGALAFCRFK